MNKKELIERMEGYENLFGNKVEYIEIDAAIKLIKQLDEPQAGHADETPRYVRNVIARLRELPLHDREVWLKAIMDEFEQDFSHAKWREGYEQGKFEGAWVGEQLKDADKIRRELSKPVVPQFVADLIEYAKDHDWDLEDTFQNIAGEADDSNIYQWYYTKSENMDTFARAWLDGYEVEKEKRYTVKMKGVHPGSVYLKRQTEDDYWYFGVNSENKCIAIKHTRKELEEAGFGWVFDCEGVEVKEVE